MSRRGGFTLIELMLAIVLTGVVGLLVYGAVGVALDTEARLHDRDAASRSERGWYVVIEDALRNLRSNADYARPTLIVSPGADGRWRPRDRLEFVTAGGTPPLTGDADWAVALEVTDDGISLTATPIGVRSPARRLLGPSSVTGLSVRVLDGGGSAQWLEEWRDRRRLPHAIELTFWADSSPVAPPILLSLPLETVP